MKPYILLFFTCFLWQCASPLKNLATNHSHDVLAKTISLEEKQNMFFQAEKINITFNKVIEEEQNNLQSTNSNQEKNKIVEIEVMSLHSRPVKYLISNSEKHNQNITSSFDFNQHHYTLLRIFKEKRGQEIKYVINLSITPLPSNR